MLKNEAPSNWSGTREGFSRCQINKILLSFSFILSLTQGVMWHPDILLYIDNVFIKSSNCWSYYFFNFSWIPATSPLWTGRRWHYSLRRWPGQSPSGWSTPQWWQATHPAGPMDLTGLSCSCSSHCLQDHWLILQHSKSSFNDWH